MGKAAAGDRIGAKTTLSAADVESCLRVLRAVETDRSLLTQLTQATRRELLTLAGLVAKPERHDLVKMARAFRRSEREAAKAHDRNLIEQTGLHLQRRAVEYAPLWLPPPTPQEQGLAPALHRQRACYVCKQPFTATHRYYDSMCAACGEFNYAKRSQTADLGGQHALVTGARVKIGYQTALKLLRAGAHVVATTRFPVDAADRYSREPDFPHFRERLQIHGLDLRHTPSVELFARFLLERLPRLDYIVNNACQTVRRPAGFFRHLLEQEAVALDALPQAWQSVLANHSALCRRLAGAPSQDTGVLIATAGRPSGEGLLHSAALSQRHYLDEDFRDGEALFPSARYDEDRQQLDLRETNSWRLRLHEVQTPELLEVQLVNAIAPYTLNARLKPLLLRTPGSHTHIVNVSAMEGQFYRTTKTDRHPHTNMAKAALNMMTRTSAPDYVKDGIHMNAVDTGWVTDEDPAAHAARKAELGFSPPGHHRRCGAHPGPCLRWAADGRARLGPVPQGLQASTLVTSEPRAQRRRSGIACGSSQAHALPASGIAMAIPPRPRRSSFMKFSTILVSALLAAAALHLPSARVTAATPEGQQCPAFLDQDYRKLHSSQSVNLCKAYAGKPMLIVNTASHCGFTPQFKGLEAIHEKYKDRGLVVVGFSSNDFNQEAKDEAEAADTCFLNYGVTFTMLAPQHVKGPEANPVFKELARQTQAPGWNFNKYLVLPDGKVAQYFDSKVTPESPQFSAAIEKILR